MHIASKKQRGFTLIEIMVVVVILGLLGTLVVQSVGNKPDQARLTKAKNDIASIENALKFYKLDNFNYPSTAQGLKALKTNPGTSKNWNGPYLDKLTQDPWGNEYQYRYPGTKGQSVDIFSFGSDGAEGGTESAADIGNWSE